MKVDKGFQTPLICPDTVVVTVPSLFQAPPAVKIRNAVITAMEAICSATKLYDPKNRPLLRD